MYVRTIVPVLTAAQDLDFNWKDLGSFSLKNIQYSVKLSFVRYPQHKNILIYLILSPTILAIYSTVGNKTQVFFKFLNFLVVWSLHLIKAL